MDEIANSYFIHTMVCEGKIMISYKKILKRILNFVLVLCVLKILSVLVILLGVICFPKSNYKMYLPWNKAIAVQVAQNYFYQNYSEPIWYSKIKIYALTEMRDKQYYYGVQFRLKNEPDVVFKIDVYYDINSEEYSIKNECYLYQVMCRRMEKDTIAIQYIIVHNSISKTFPNTLMAG